VLVLHNILLVLLFLDIIKGSSGLNTSYVGISYVVISYVGISYVGAGSNFYCLFGLSYLNLYSLHNY